MKPRIIYTCSYIPNNELSKYGYEMVSMYEVEGLEKTRGSISGNICSFLKKVYAYDYSCYDGIILTNCCNNAQRIYDYLKYHYPMKFIYMLDLPREQISVIDFEPLLNALNEHFHRKDQFSTISSVPIDTKSEEADILMISSSLHKEYINQLQRLFHTYRIKVETCYGVNRGDRILNGEFVSCPRMFDYRRYIEQEIEKVKAVVFITIANCDPCIFSQPFVQSICKERGKKFLFVEEEYSNYISERSNIRYEAFIESLRIRNEM